MLTLQLLPAVAVPAVTAVIAAATTTAAPANAPAVAVLLLLPLTPPPPSLLLLLPPMLQLLLSLPLSPAAAAAAAELLLALMFRTTGSVFERNYGRVFCLGAKIRRVPEMPEVVGMCWSARCYTYTRHATRHVL